MKILFITNDLIAGNLAHQMTKEGCKVRLFIESKQQGENFSNLVPKTTNWKKELKWVGKDGLIVFDDVGYGSIQDELRLQGYSVFGGTRLGDKLELDRYWAQEIFKKYGMQALPTQNFDTLDDCISFVKKNPGPWVIKQNNHASKSLNYVGIFEDNRDVMDVLLNYKKNFNGNLRNITLQKRVYGVEIGVGRYFNGTDWASPIELNVEYKKFFNGDLGPSTSEMGTIGWYDTNENNKLFQATLAKLKPYLQKINYKGDIDIGCIVNKNGVFPLEASPRMGSPIVHLHNELHISPWHEFLKAIADGKKYKLKWKKGYGIVVLVAVPPFPYIKKLKGNSSFGVKVYFDESLSQKDIDSHVHFEEISVEKSKKGKNEYYISDHRGYVLYVTGVAKTIKDVRKKVYSILEKIYIPKMFYRSDIGLSFEQSGLKQLKAWGYL